MSATTPATTIATTTTPVQRPRTVVDADATRRAASQRAATEGRLELLIDATITEDSTRGSLVGVTGGIIGFVTFMVAVPLVAWAYLARLHHGSWQLNGVALPVLVLVNLALGYGTTVAHEWLHAATARTQGGNAFLVPTTPYRYAWTAPGQGFSRAGYALVLIAPLIIVAVIWLVALVINPAIAAYLIVPATVNAALAGADLWTLVEARRQSAQAAIFVDRHPGFAAYAITAVKSVKKSASKKVTK